MIILSHESFVSIKFCFILSRRETEANGSQQLLYPENGEFGEQRGGAHFPRRRNWCQHSKVLANVQAATHVTYSHRPVLRLKSMDPLNSPGEQRVVAENTDIHTQMVLSQHGVSKVEPHKRIGFSLEYSSRSFLSKVGYTLGSVFSILPRTLMAMTIALSNLNVAPYRSSFTLKVDKEGILVF